MTRLSRLGAGLALAIWALAIWALAILATPVMAQVPLTPAGPAPFDPDATLVEELVVTARERGPAFWTVRDADSVVHVLGVPSVAPKKMQWDQAGFMRRLKGANAVILPARDNKLRLASVPGAAIAYLKLKSSTPFEETLPEPERARFVAARESLGRPAKRYETRNALAAGVLMIGDYREKHTLTDSDPSKLIRYLAQQAGVPTVNKSYDLGPLLGALAKTKAGAGRVCLDAVLAEVGAGPAATLAATRAWAEGDVRGALAQERTYERCLNAAPGAAAFDERVKADQAALIAQALKAPGHAIAVVPLRPLLAQGGVLDRLRAQGFEVGTPGDVGNAED